MKGIKPLKYVFPFETEVVYSSKGIKECVNFIYNKRIKYRYSFYTKRIIFFDVDFHVSLGHIIAKEIKHNRKIINELVYDDHKRRKTS